MKRVCEDCQRKWVKSSNVHKPVCKITVEAKSCKHWFNHPELKANRDSIQKGTTGFMGIYGPRVNTSHQQVRSGDVMKRRHWDEMRWEGACKDEVKTGKGPSSAPITAYHAERRVPQWLVTTNTPCLELRNWVEERHLALEWRGTNQMRIP